MMSKWSRSRAGSPDAAGVSTSTTCASHRPRDAPSARRTTLPTPSAPTSTRADRRRPALVVTVTGSAAPGGSTAQIRSSVQIRGDAEIANSYRELFAAARPDLEEELSRWVDAAEDKDKD